MIRSRLSPQHNGAKSADPGPVGLVDEDQDVRRGVQLWKQVPACSLIFFTASAGMAPSSLLPVNVMGTSASRSRNWPPLVIARARSSPLSCVSQMIPPGDA